MEEVVGLSAYWSSTTVLAYASFGSEPETGSFVRHTLNEGRLCSPLGSTAGRGRWRSTRWGIPCGTWKPGRGGYATRGRIGATSPTPKPRNSCSSPATPGRRHRGRFACRLPGAWDASGGGWLGISDVLEKHKILAMGMGMR